MGYKNDKPDEVVEELYRECLAEYQKAASYKAVCRKVPVLLKENGRIDFGFCSIENENFYKNMKNCSSAYVFAATAGVGVDRLIMRYTKISPAEGMICDSIASSAVDVWCDKVNVQLAETEKISPRFSPGYGGVSLEHQKEILSFLDAEKKLGIVLTDSFMMIPAKSVTAFIGVCEE